MSDKKALNRGLEALLGETKGEALRSVKEIPVSEITPGRFQPDKTLIMRKYLSLLALYKNMEFYHLF